jgi:BlaI family transcriptional regulator, penicillinase repressor
MKTDRKLPRREREIMDVLFQLGTEASAEEIRERLTDPPSYSAVRAMLAKLEAKGAVRHREKGLRYVYSPTVPRTAARRSALKRMVQVFFDGSAGQAMTALLNEEKWSEEELDRLADEVERARKERKRS